VTHSVTTTTDSTEHSPPPNHVAAQREFPVGAVLTLTCGSIDRPFCGLRDLYTILGYLLADVPAADDMADAITRCRPLVLTQHPDLGAVSAPPVDAPDTVVLAWLAAQESRFGTTLVLSSSGRDQ
jgi:hypothetical protein